MKFLQFDICESILASELAYEPGFVEVDSIRLITTHETGTAIYFKHLIHPVYVKQSLKEVVQQFCMLNTL